MKFLAASVKIDRTYFIHHYNRKDVTRIMFETDISNIWGSIEFSDLMKMEDRLSQAHNTLAQGTGEGNDFLGWYHLPSHTTEDELDEIRQFAEFVKNKRK